MIIFEKFSKLQKEIFVFSIWFSFSFRFQSGFVEEIFFCTFFEMFNHWILFCIRLILYINNNKIICIRFKRTGTPFLSHLLPIFFICLQSFPIYFCWQISRAWELTKKTKHTQALSVKKKRRKVLWKKRNENGNDIQKNFPLKMDRKIDEWERKKNTTLLPSQQKIHFMNATILNAVWVFFSSALIYRKCNWSIFHCAMC